MHPLSQDVLWRLTMVTVVSIAVFFVSRWRRALKQRREEAKLEDTWGQPGRGPRRPELTRKLEVAEVAKSNRVDDGTWSDLELDQVFGKIDRTLSFVGAQVLWQWLRHPLQTQAAIAERRAFIDGRVAVAGRRAALQVALARLGDREGWTTVTALYESFPMMPGPLLLYRVLPFALLGSVGATIVLRSALWLAVAIVLALGLPAIHYVTDRTIGPYLHALVGLRRILAAAVSLDAVDPDAISGRLDKSSPSLARLHKSLGVARKSRGGLVGQATGLTMEYGRAFLLSQLRTYKQATNAIQAHRDHLRDVFRLVGEIDAAISVAHLRAHDKAFVAATVDDSEGGIHARGLSHPLLVPDAVGNDLVLVDAGLLITGSNMGGKSTFLRAVGINVVLAQSIGLAVAREYRAPPLCVSSSMQVVDDLGGGISMYRAEVDRIGELIARSERGRQLFLLDEVFRGTNANERIAAGVAVLRYLAKQSLVIAATHDREMCEALEGALTMGHFTEIVEGDDVQFDYTLRPGVLQSTNALALLERAGYPESILAEAYGLAKQAVAG